MLDRTTVTRVKCEGPPQQVNSLYKAVKQRPLVERISDAFLAKLAHTDWKFGGFVLHG